MFKCFRRRDRGPVEGNPKEVYSTKPKVKKIALVVGHSHRDKGATAYTGAREWDWWNNVIMHMENKIWNEVEFIILHRDGYIGYSSAMKLLAMEAKERGCDLAIEFHLNASGIPGARGCEMLIKDGDDESAKIAAILIGRFSERFNISKRRQYKGIQGIKALKRSSRGGAFVYEMNKRGIKSMLFEPFFCDYETRDSGPFFESTRSESRGVTEGWEKMVDFWCEELVKLKGFHG